MKYSKPALTIEEQINLLKKRNLIIEDDNEARIALNNISYYRLSSYLYPFREKDYTSQNFYQGTNFNDILKIYSFDRKLRLLLFDAIERIEIAFRTQFILKMSLKYDPFWYNNPNYFFDKNKFSNIIKSFQDEYKISHEVFIKHYQKKYNEPKFPPAWMSLEIFTLGHLSRHYSNLINFADKKMIARYFGVEAPVFESWLHTICYIRNICAHHSRLWNRKLRVTPIFPKSSDVIDKTTIKNDRVYSIIRIIQYLLKVVHPENTFSNKLKKFLSDYPVINPSKMGFPNNWTHDDFWNDK